MTDGRLIENQFLSAPESIFQSADFFRLHSTDPAQAVFFDWESRGKGVAAIHFTDLGAGHWRSPGKGTFAGYWFNPSLQLAELAAFHDAVEQRLVALGATSIEILTAPQAHDPAGFAIATYLLLIRKFLISQQDLNYSMSIATTAFSERMNYGNRKRLRKCADQALVAQQLPIEKLSDVYATISANRAAKGHPVSMTFDQLAEMAAAFPGRLNLFGIPTDGTLAAAAICLRISDSIMYIFYWGDRPGYSTLSPVVALANCIYEHCQSNGITLLDVGTSTIGADANHGLIQFKRGLGFEESLKLRFMKRLSTG